MERGAVPKHLHIINPASDFPSYHSAEVYAASGVGGRVSVADLAITTLAALVPDGWRIRLTDEAIEPLDDGAISGDNCDIVAITGKVSQRNRMIELARAYRSRGTPVVIGGSYASLNPEDMRPHADVLVTGEAEEIAAGLFADLAAGRARRHYQGTRPDLARSPVPRWDLYPNGRAQMGAIQTSRGCPFTCDFCDVIQYLGRHQRHKAPAQVIAELDVLYRHGYRYIFLADDNFTVYRRHAHAVLDALRDWNGARGRRATFMTQASLDVARDASLLEACRSASLESLYIGVETVNKESLSAAGKKQNLHQDTAQAVETIVGHGIAVYAGIIVGFDADTPSIFQTMATFINTSPLPLLAVGALVAPRGTPLHDRLAAEGRLTGAAWQSANNPFATNIVPAAMTREDLLTGLAGLCADIYAPTAFETRVRHFLSAFGACRRDRMPQEPRGLHISAPDRQILKRLSGRGREEKRMILDLLDAAVRRPDAAFHVLNFLLRYAQVRHVLAAGGVPIGVGRIGTTATA